MFQDFSKIKRKFEKIIKLIKFAKFVIHHEI